jgi:hypothetical protein
MSKSLALSLFTAAAFSAFALACSSSPSGEGSASSGQAVTAPTSNVDPAFAVCGTDLDCVSVPQAGCCHNGWLAAVSSSSTADYAAANTCTQQPVFCPLYIVNDNRLPECLSNQCAMVAPSDIDCGWDHACPSGYGCQRSNGHGTCVQGAPSTCGDDAGSNAGDDAGTTTTTANEDASAGDDAAPSGPTADAKHRAN